MKIRMLVTYTLACKAEQTWEYLFDGVQFVCLPTIRETHRTVDILESNLLAQPQEQRGFDGSLDDYPAPDL